MIIGNFAYDADRDSYTGTITTLTLQRGQVVFRAIEKSAEKEPDYRIVHEQGSDAAVELGAAWKRSSERGRPFLSVVLDDPALPSSLNAAMFLSDEDERATLVWQRQMKKPASGEPEPASKRAKKPAAARNPRLG